MESSKDSLELLAHFDRSTQPRVAGRAAVPWRGVGWVLSWCAAGATLVAGFVLLAQFGYGLAAERDLFRAAQAGVLEATLPRATRASVVRSIERRLDRYPVGRLRIVLQQNGRPVPPAIRAGEGDWFAVTIAASSREMLPSWLGGLSIGHGDAPIVVRAERRIPGRHLASR